MFLLYIILCTYIVLSDKNLVRTDIHYVKIFSIRKVEYIIPTLHFRRIVISVLYILLFTCNVQNQLAYRFFVTFDA